MSEVRLKMSRNKAKGEKCYCNHLRSRHVNGECLSCARQLYPPFGAFHKYHKAGKLACTFCHFKKPDVEERLDMYAYEINDEEQYYDMCVECYESRKDEV